MDLLITLLACLGLVVLSGYFSGIETGVYSLNRVRHQIRRRHGDPRAATVEGLLSRPGRLISTMLVGNNIVNYSMTSIVTLYFLRLTSETGDAATAIAGGLAAAGPATLAAASGARADLLTTVTLTPFLFVFGEVAPKDLFRRRADGLVYALAWPTEIVARVFRPASWPLEMVSNALTRLAGASAHGEEGDGAGGSDFLVHVVASGAEAGVLTDYQDQLARNVVALRGRQLGDVMIPARRVARVEPGATAEAARAVAAERKRSRLPVGGDDGRWVGVVNIFELFFALEPGDPIDKVVRDVPRLPQTLTVERAIAIIRRSRQPMAFVVGQGGRCVGVVTLKDLVEEIVGELKDL